MRSVLDAPVALKWVLPEIDADKAEALREGFRRGNLDLLAPDVFPTECGHTLSKKQRRGLIPDAISLWDEIMVDAPDLVPCLPLIKRALEISTNAKVAVYDRLYVALAEREGCELITADERLVRNIQVDFPIIVPFASF